MLDRQLTDRRIAEAIMRSEKLEVEFDKLMNLVEKPLRVKFTIFSTESGDGRGYIFGEGIGEEIWSIIRAKLEEYNL